MTVAKVRDLKQPAAVETELAAMQAAHDALAGLDRPAQRRALAWLDARLQPAGSQGRDNDDPWRRDDKPPF